jgi:hypothetical protein
MSDTALLRAAKLWEKTSERNGRRYLTGRLGGLRVLIFENHDKKNAGDPTHFLLFGEAPDKPRQGEKGS